MAPSTERIIRRLPPARVADFDDQLWPVNCAILILAGFAAGLAIATGDFHADRLLTNAWFRLGLVGLGMVVLLAAVLFLQRRMVRRVQLCVVISLLFHLWLGMVLHQQYLAAVAAQQQSKAVARRTEPEHVFRVPDYYWENLDRPQSRHTFEEPVATEPAKPTDPEPLTKQSVEHELSPEAKPDVQPDRPRQQGPEPAELRRAAPSAPRRDVLAAGEQISRQPQRQAMLPDEPMPMPSGAPRYEKQTNRLRAVASAPERRPGEVAVSPPRGFERRPTATQDRPAASVARRDAPEPRRSPPLTAAAPIPKHSAVAELAEAEIALPRPTLRRELPLETLDAATAGQARRMPGAVATRSEPRPNVAATEAAHREDLAMRGRPSSRRDRSPKFNSPSPPIARSEPRPAADALPSAAALPPAPRGLVAAGGPPSRIDATGAVAVTRSTAQAPMGERIAAAGTVEPAIGSGPVPARMGQPRATGRDRPAMVAADSAPKLARSDASGVALQAAPIPAAFPAPEGPAATHAGAAPRQTAAAEATAIVRGGSAAPPGARPNAGSGPEAARPGAPGPVGAAMATRVTRHEAVSAGLSGGGTPSPANRPAVVSAPEATFDMPQVAAVGSQSGRPGGTPMESAAGGATRRATGLPGGRPGPPPRGAIASLEPSGSRGPVAAAHRATPSQRDSGGAGAVPDRAATIARSDLGSRLPALDDVLMPSSASGGAGSSPGETAEVGEPARLGGLEVGDLQGDQRSPPATVPLGGKGHSAAGVTAGVDRPGPPTTAAGAGPRRLAAPNPAATALAADTSGGVPPARHDAPGLPWGLAEPIDVTESGPVRVASVDEAEPGEPTVAPAVGIEQAASGSKTGGLPVLIKAKLGPGGLSHEPSPVVGIPSRQARRESLAVHVARQRFLMDRGGGPLPLDGQLIELPAEAFLQRDPGQRARTAELYGGTEGTERAVEAGLAFLVRCQFDDGHWSLDQLPEEMRKADDPALGQMTSDTAATGLALLSFLGAGYTHEADKHRDVVRRGLDWLRTHQKGDGDLFAGGTGYAWLYSHGIATIALCEAYGMTRDTALREPAQRAIGFIVASQHPQRGGWRYKPRVESDTSVAGWQLMAMKSAQMANLKAPEATFEAVSRWLDAAQSRDGARYAYNPYAGDTSEQRHGRQPSLAMTAEGALMRMYLGWNRDHPALRDAADYFEANSPALGTPDRPTRDVYYWYYATQVMFQMQGEHWESWNRRLQSLLQGSQQAAGPLAGSWHPAEPVRDRWGHAGGRLYVTTMNLLMLEVYYRHLPLFQTLE